METNESRYIIFTTKICRRAFETRLEDKIDVFCLFVSQTDGKGAQK